MDKIDRLIRNVTIAIVDTPEKFTHTVSGGSETLMCKTLSVIKQGFNISLYIGVREIPLSDEQQDKLFTSFSSFIVHDRDDLIGELDDMLKAWDD